MSRLLTRNFSVKGWHRFLGLIAQVYQGLLQGYYHRGKRYPKPGARFSKAPETFRARKAIFSSSVSKNGEVYTPETSCMKGTCVHIKKM